MRAKRVIPGETVCADVELAVTDDDEMCSKALLKVEGV